MKICIEQKDKVPPVYTINRIAGHIYLERKPLYNVVGNYHICIKLNHEEKYHLYSLETGLCVTASEGTTLESSKWVDVTDLVSLKSGGCNE